uniref:Group II SELF-splicing intron ORF (Fragments) n=1 Tax=Azotobacter vinelandii TaxID=354 RepID=Q9R669_AZOVI
SGRYPSGKLATLLYADDTTIQRHKKIRAEANPYLWLGQSKRCPMCKQLITFETGWNIHHIIKRHMGGGDELDNLVLLHPNCHRQLH